MSNEETLAARTCALRRSIERANEEANDAAYQMAMLLIGRLRKVCNRSALDALKRELADYNIKTGRWKS